MSNRAAVLPVLSILWLLASPAQAHEPEPEGRGSTIFIGMNLGLGAARIAQPGLGRQPRLGLEYDAAFGFGLTRRWAAGLELATWQPFNIDGNPSHIHMFAWRLEHTFGDRDGLVATTALGLGLGDGRKTKRIGSGGLLQLGYRFPVARNVTLALEGGVRGVISTDGSSVAPFVALQLRFYGRSSLDWASRSMSSTEQVAWAHRVW